MLKFFKHSYLSQHIVVIVMAIILWLPTFITKSAFFIGDDNTPLYNIIISLFDFSPFIINTIVFAIFVISLFLFNSVLSANRLVNKYSTVGSYTFVLMMCVSSNMPACYPFILACPFILMAMHTLFLIYQTENPENYMMNIGYFIAVASLFYYPSIFLMLWVFVSFLILGFRKLRYILIPFVAFMIVNAIVIGLAFLFGNYDNLIESYSSFFNNITLSSDMTVGNVFMLILTTFLFIISLIKVLGSRNSDYGSNFKKRVGVGIVMTVLSALVLFMHGPLMGNIMIFMMYAFFYAIALSDMKKSKIADIVMIVMTVIILANQYLPLFGITI